MVLRPVEFVRILRRINSTFEAFARDASGAVVHVCVKPQLYSRPEETGERLIGEWLGYRIAEIIGLPVPRLLKINLTLDFISSAGPQLRDVIPGVALATEWQEHAFEYPFFPTRSAVRNAETVAGVTVLDTIQHNGDRREDNVLALPDLTSSGAKFFLAYIDNGWLVWARFKDKLKVLPAKLPLTAALRSMVADEEEFGPYLLMAEGLDHRRLEDHLSHAPLDQWPAEVFDVAVLPDETIWRASKARESIAMRMNEFPLLLH